MNQSSPQPGPTKSWRRRLEAFVERVGVRPVSLLVFVGSVVLLIGLHMTTITAPMRAPAVAQAPPVEHPAAVDSVVVKVHVDPGAIVEPGHPLVTLSPTRIERELRLVNAEIVRLENEAELAQVEATQAWRDDASELERALADARRDAARARARARARRSIRDAAREHHAHIVERVEARRAPTSELPDAELQKEAEEARTQEARRIERAEEARVAELERRLESRPSENPIGGPTARVHAARLEQLRVRRDALREDLNHTTVLASRSGRVATVLPVGAATPIGTSVAAIVPPRATEIVAWLEPDVSPARIVPGARAEITKPTDACGGATSHVLRRGAAVTQAPDHVLDLAALFGPRVVHGTPIYLEVPDGCELGVGQQLEVELEPAL